ncbi:MAG TPA: hypothetical protein VGG41_00245 [Solirubrobacteraceae bacterium]
MTSPSAEVAAEAAERIKGWLLTSAIQIETGPQRGGIAGGLAADGKPDYVYLEITGYYLTATAWLIASASEDGDAAAARARGQRALEWLADAADSGEVPATRLYLRQEPEDWRNDAIFTFDLAMAARGVARFVEAGGSQPRAAAATAALMDALAEVDAGTPTLRSHRARGGKKLPQRWSTLPGPHHLKAAAALLGLPCSAALASSAALTISRWSESVQEDDAVPELHPRLYALEGIAMDVPGTLNAATAPFRRLMEGQRDDGTLPAESPDDGTTRSDVLAQALRIGVILKAAGMLGEDGWCERLGLLASRLLEHVGADGSVRFSIDSGGSNAWCAMFAQQALVLYAAPSPPTIALGRRYMV